MTPGSINIFRTDKQYSAMSAGLSTNYYTYSILCDIGPKFQGPGGQGQAKVKYNPSTPPRIPLIFQKGVTIDLINTKTLKHAIESILALQKSSLMDFAAKYIARGVSAVRGALK